MVRPAASLPRLSMLALVLALTVAVSVVNTTGAGQFRINCGASVSATDSDGRAWDGDAAASRFAPSVSGVAAGAPHEDPSLPSAVPYMTARVFDSSYTYSFPVRPGRVFLRLYFYPSPYAGRGAGDALFGVAAGGVTLLRDFNASQAAVTLDVAYLVREFSLNVGGGGLDVTFAPSSAGHYAFVNGIEIVPVPSDLFSTTDPVPTFANGWRFAATPIGADTAFQTMYRLNVGGAPVSPGADSGPLYRSWGDDAPYIFGAAFGVSYGKDSNVTIQYSASVPPYMAPASVYATARSMGPAAQVNLNYNLTWLLPVDTGFSYLLRLHFCEIQSPITRPNQRSFNVYVDNQTVQEGIDVIALSGGIGRPGYADYVVAVTAPVDDGRQTDLWVALHPDVNTLPEFYDAILNGLEVFKLQPNGTGSLAAASPPVPDVDAGSSGNAAQARPKRKSRAFVAGWAAGAGGLVAVLVGCLCAWGICRRQERKAASAVVHVPDEPVRGTPAPGPRGPTETYQK